MGQVGLCLGVCWDHMDVSMRDLETGDDNGRPRNVKRHLLRRPDNLGHTHHVTEDGGVKISPFVDWLARDDEDVAGSDRLDSEDRYTDLVCPDEASGNVAVNN